MNICAVRLLTELATQDRYAISPETAAHEPTLMPSDQPLRYALIDLTACMEGSQQPQQPQQPCAVCRHCGCVFVEG